MATYSPVSSISDHHVEEVVETPRDIRRKPVPQAQYVQIASSAVSSTPASRPSKSKRVSFLKSWVLELFSCLLAFIALAAIVITLKIQDARPLPEWPKLITVNSLVAVFTAILKAAMIVPVAESIGELKWLWYSTPRALIDMEYFDSASRGPLGSLDLLRRLPRALLPGLGAIITIVALAIDPFTQQIIQYYNCQQPSTQLAQVTRVNTYNYSDENPNSSGYLLDSAMTAVLYQGLISPPANASAPITFSCPTGECSFPTRDNVAYHSLAMCSTVTDISNTIRSTSSSDPESAFWGYSIPSGIAIDGPGRGGYTAITLSIENLGRSWKNTSHPPLFAFDVLMATLPGSTVVPKAFRAEIAPCVNAYSGAKVQNLTLTETIVSSTRLTSIDNTTTPYFSLVGDFPASPESDCTPALQPGGKKTQATHLWSDGSRFVAESGWVHDSDQDTQWYDPACAYSFGPGSTDALRINLPMFFGSTNDSSSSNTSGGMPAGLVWQGVGPQIVTGSNWLKAMYNGGQGSIVTVEATVEGLANAMTAQMRKVGIGSAAIGSTFTMQTCIHVEWAWLALTAALLGLTTILLFSTMWLSRRNRPIRRLSTTQQPPDDTVIRQKGAYKTASLPLLWCGPDNEMKEQQSPLMSVQDMEKRSRMLLVQLVEKEGRLNLDYVGTKPSKRATFNNKTPGS